MGFVAKVAGGEVPTEAAMQVYGNSSRNAARVQSSRNLQNPRIRAEIVRICLGDPSGTPESLAGLVLKWLHNGDGNISHKWFTTFMKLVDRPQRVKHSHLHFEVPKSVRRFILEEGRLPTQDELEELSRRDAAGAEATVGDFLSSS